MEDFAFGTVLFIAYFSFVCLLIHHPAEATVTTVSQDFVALEANEKLSQVDDKEEVSPQPKEPSVSTLSSDELEGGIDIDTLQLRPARKIAKALGIKQTVTNGGKKKDKPLGWLRREIKQKLQQNPQAVAPVIKKVLAAA